MSNIDRRSQCYSVLGSQDKRLSIKPEVRYFLIRMLFTYGLETVDCDSLELARQAGLTDYATRKSKDLLEDLGYLKKFPLHETGINQRGRPKNSFALSKDQIDQLTSNSSNRELIHAGLIDTLLFWNGDPNERLKSLKQDIDAGDRILLAILYLHADACGVVRHLSFSDLKRLTGMKQDRLELRLEKLKSLGIVLVWVSGLTGKYALGRVKSIFYLNLCLDKSSHKFNSLIVYCSKRTLALGRDEMLIARIASWVSKDKMNSHNKSSHKKITSSGLQEIKSDVSKIFLYGIHVDEDKQAKYIGLEPLAKNLGLVINCTNDQKYYWMDQFSGYGLFEILKEIVSIHFYRYLAVKINEYASILLTQFWSDIGSRCEKFREELVEKIRLDLYPEKLWLREREPEENELLGKLIAILFYRIAYEMAFHYKVLASWIMEDPDSSIGDCIGNSYAILPLTIQNGDSRSVKLAMTISATTSCFRHSSVLLDFEGTPFQEYELSRNIEIKNELPTKTYDEVDTVTFFSSVL